MNIQNMGYWSTWPVIIVIGLEKHIGRPQKTHRPTPNLECIVLDMVCKPFLNSSFLEVLIMKHFTVDILIN